MVHFGDFDLRKVHVVQQPYNPTKCLPVVPDLSHLSTVQRTMTSPLALCCHFGEWRFVRACPNEILAGNLNIVVKNMESVKGKTKPIQKY